MITLQTVGGITFLKTPVGGLSMWAKKGKKPLIKRTLVALLLAASTLNAYQLITAPTPFESCIEEHMQDNSAVAGCRGE